MEDTKRNVKISIVDAFAQRPFEGNPAAVCFIGDKNPCDDILQAIASEMNQAETAFLVSTNDNYKDGSNFGLRWFTPTNEVPLCGHATLASAAALFEVAGNSNSKITFSTLSGDLYATKDGNGFIDMDLPLNEPLKVSASAYRDINAAVLGDMSSVLNEVWLSKSAKKLLLKMKTGFSLAQLCSINPNFSKMLSLHDGSEFKGVIVTADARDSETHDFYSRYFAPWNGIPEDHVTGSAHTVLAPFWFKITKKREMLGRQCSKRGGNVKVKLRGDGRVDVGGRATVVMKGTFSFPL